ncbi:MULTISPECIES: DUF7573 domain-containing protein [Haloarcula]|uniref:DUF7573 domain-containing protein n=1 Tax=Haloarcula TaxID=2237 RepID=UPI0023EBDFE5|nr:hypothetical protein [Halomicroarcula sp. XH51]
MAEDASLDDFLGSGDDNEDDTGASDPDGSADGPGGAATADTDATTGETEGGRTTSEPGGDGVVPGDEAVTPATTTYAWSDEGTTCGSCGAPAERRWHQDGALVCPDCKEW